MTPPDTLPATDSEIDVTFFVSCYNEQELISDTLDTLFDALQASGLSYEIIVVDDFSSDNSITVINNWIRLHPACFIRLRTLDKNRGLSNNFVDTAFCGRGKYYRLCTGDDSESLEALLKILKQIGKADMIIPYQNQDEVVGKSYLRRSLSKLFTIFVNSLYGANIKYYNGMAVHLRYNVMRYHPSSYGFGFQADLITRLLDEGASYVQVPITGTVDRKPGNSTALNMRNLLSIAHTLVEIAIRRLRRIIYGRSGADPFEIPFQED